MNTTTRNAKLSTVFTMESTAMSMLVRLNSDKGDAADMVAVGKAVALRYLGYTMQKSATDCVRLSADFTGRHYYKTDAGQWYTRMGMQGKAERINADRAKVLNLIVEWLSADWPPSVHMTDWGIAADAFNAVLVAAGKKAR